MILEKFYRFFRENWWIIILLLLCILGVCLSFIGLSKIQNIDSFYETARLILLNVQFEKDWFPLPCTLIAGRWLLFATLVWFSFRLFFEIIAPQFLKNLKILCYRNHIVICGLNKITINLAENLIQKHGKKEIIVLANETNRYTEVLKALKIKLIVGDFTDNFFLRKAKIKKARELYAVTDNDKINMKIAHAVFSYFEKEKRKNDALKCFVLIKDRELKTILEESILFKYKNAAFDGLLCNINEMGMKYALTTNIDKILPKKITTPPEILLVGLTEKTEIALLNLVHCLTMQRETFKFTIVEKNLKKIKSFQKKYTYLQDFAEIRIVNEIEKNKSFDSVLVCSENHAEALKHALEIHYLLGEDNPEKNILIFCNEVDTFYEALKNEWLDKKIFSLNLFAQIADYVFELDNFIENNAKKTHFFWNTLYNQNRAWDDLSGHFKQSNRNQILDHYLKIYIARGEKYKENKNRLVSFSDYEKETLARMEHRRWCMEKFDNNWVAGERNNELKRHDCLVAWEKLSEEQQAKDYDAIILLIKLLNN